MKLLANAIFLAALFLSPTAYGLLCDSCYKATRTLVPGEHSAYGLTSQAPCGYIHPDGTECVKIITKEFAHCSTCPRDFGRANRFMQHAQVHDNTWSPVHKDGTRKAE
ncbi:hypothetical protein PtB15_4B590 [Puccinia triticina]|nr:hypothetical protein PtB15_4B590 [Puccinia triticina]